MSNNISANTVFHFMDKREYLEEALKGNFSPRLCKEENLFLQGEIYLAAKCFCDIPLTLVSKHAERYGKYAIGFNKDWGVKIGLNPVTYYNSESSFIQSIKKVYNANIEEINANPNDYKQDSDARVAIFTQMQLAFLNFKPIKGRMWRGDRLIEDVNFYDEKEWRYIGKCGYDYTGNHNIIKFLKYKPFLRQNEIEKEIIKSVNDYISGKEKIEFKSSDVNYIIVKSEDDVYQIAKLINSISELTEKDKEILKTKITSYDTLELNI